ncbi:MAG: ring-cleaving dioxygenase [Bacteroidota bacterium]
MSNKILGIHHVTAIATDAQKNVDFYRNVLGLRLVKKTVNFDDPQTYHLYYGDEVGNPGSILTFFPWSLQAPKGRKGTGQGTSFSFSVPKGSLDFWKEHLKKLNVLFVEQTKRFDEEILTLLDHDEFEIELVANGTDNRTGWDNGRIPAGAAIRGFHSVTLSEQQLTRTAGFMQAALGFRKVAEAGNRHRYEVAVGGSGTYVDVLVQPDVRRGVMGAGIIHHLAFRTPDDDTQLRVRDFLCEAHHNVTDVADRQYFKSIYFHEPGGFLFEVATDPPGFMFDESKEELGTHLKLPPWLEKHRRAIEEVLPPIKLKTRELAGAKA